jgi:hypothetical protein
LTAAVTVLVSYETMDPVAPSTIALSAPAF